MHSCLSHWMIDTTRIRTGFDVELNLGTGWFQTTLQALADAGRLFPQDAPPPFEPDAEVTIESVDILLDGEQDLSFEATIAGAAHTVLASLSIDEGDEGTELRMDTDIPGVSTTVPFDAVDDVAGVPTLVKVAGGGGFDAAFAVLANLDIRASPQSAEPLPGGEHLPRGEVGLAQSFLPTGRDLAVGIGSDSFPRFANDVWHGALRAEDGKHPLPNEEDPKGSWTAVRLHPQEGRFRLTLLGTVPIDFFPDGTVTVTVDLEPRIDGGGLAFDLSIDTDIDTGLLGDLFAALIGGLTGLIVGAFTGGVLLGPATGAILGVIALEVAEVIIDDKVRKLVRASLREEPHTAVLACDDDVIVEAVPHPDEPSGIALGPLTAMPRSIVVGRFRPDLLHTKFVLVTTDFAEITCNGSGFAAAGAAHATERFVPRRASLLRREVVTCEEGDERVELVYGTADPEAEQGAEVEVRLAFDEVVERAERGALTPPLELRFMLADADVTLLDSRVPSVCLRPTNVRRREAVVTDIRFSTGLELTVPEAVRLQDAGALILQNLQLIHPRNTNPYYRSFADGNIENNFENLPSY